MLTLTEARVVALYHHDRGEPRPETRGELRLEAVLPLELCAGSNRTRGAAGWALARAKRALWQELRKQVTIAEAPLPGRPLVIVTRISSVEPDKYADWGKAAVDMLCIPRGRATLRLGYLVDDSPTHAEVWQLWRPGKRGNGAVYLEVWA